MKNLIKNVGPGLLIVSQLAVATTATATYQDLLEEDNIDPTKLNDVKTLMIASWVFVFLVVLIMLVDQFASHNNMANGGYIFMSFMTIILFMYYGKKLNGDETLSPLCYGMGAGSFVALLLCIFKQTTSGNNKAIIDKFHRLRNKISDIKLRTRVDKAVTNDDVTPPLVNAVSSETGLSTEIVADTLTNVANIPDVPVLTVSVGTPTKKNLIGEGESQGESQGEPPASPKGSPKSPRLGADKFMSKQAIAESPSILTTPSYVESKVKTEPAQFYFAKRGGRKCRQ